MLRFQKRITILLKRLFQILTLIIVPITIIHSSYSIYLYNFAGEPYLTSYWTLSDYTMFVDKTGQTSFYLICIFIIFLIINYIVFGTINLIKLFQKDSIQS